MCPCKDCADRSIACHGSCEKYKTWSAEEQQKKEWLKEKNTYTTSFGLQYTKGHRQMARTATQSGLRNYNRKVW